MNEILQILLVEDNPGDADLIKERLSGTAVIKTGIEVVDRLSLALESIASNSIDIVILDLGLPDSNGLETIRAVRRGTATLPIVVLTGNDDEKLGLAAIQEGAQEYLVKGKIDGSQLVRAIRYAVERKRSEEKHLRMEAQFHQAQKMESVGRLAGGVAHDFNNMLSVIIGYAEMALKKLGPSNKISLDIQKILTAGQKSADLTRQLLAFARKQTFAPMVLDLNHTVGNMTLLIGRLIGEEINLSWKPSDHLPHVMMDPSQMDQILANLLVNARDAISGVGMITIETGLVEFDKDYCSFHTDFVPGRYVQLTVSDNGCGMDKKTQERIFEPFFTTKELGKGTGLGLATVFGIVRQNNGLINVYSEPGTGTTFKIYIPEYVPEHEARIMHEPIRAPAGTETVLVVEDEKALLELIIIMFEELGYPVLGANNAIQAIKLCEEFNSDIHLLLTDVMMPEMSGHDLWEKLSPLRPEMKCLYMSGYTADVIAHHGILDDGVNFISKPFSKEVLAVKIREVLDG